MSLLCARPARLAAHLRMARLLVATVPLTGHVRPMRVLVQALTDRGHEVHWYTGRRFAAAVEGAGARFEPLRAAREWDDAGVEAALPAPTGRHGLSRVKAELRAMFIEPMCDQLGDLEGLTEKLAPDAVIGDSAHLGAALLAEKRGVPWVSLGISPLVLPSEDTAPFGSALPPGTRAFHRLRNRLLNWAVLRVLFADVNGAYRRGRVAAGLPAGEATYFDVLSPDLHLQPVPPSFEYPRRRLPPQVHFIGPLVPRSAASAPSVLPAWWPDVQAARARGVPVVLVHQGTLATEGRELVLPTLRGLADEPLLVVATTPADLAALGMRSPPANARVASFVPHEALLPYVSVMVTNGGYHGTQLALGHGVPLVVAAGSEDKPEVAARVAWSGVGLDLRTGRPTPHAVRRAVRRVLAEPRFEQRARELSAHAAGLDGASRGAELVEALVRARGSARVGARADAA